MGRRLCTILLTGTMIAVIALVVITGSVQAAPGVMGDRLTVQEAGTIALWFIANDMETSEDSGWTSETRIARIRPLFSERKLLPDFYALELQTGTEMSGYVVVSAVNDVNYIHEFAYSGRPAYYEIASGPFDTVYLTGPLAYAVGFQGTIRGPGGKVIPALLMRTSFLPNEQARMANSKLLEVLVEKGFLDLDQWMLGYAGQISGQSGYGGIYDPYAYVNDRYGSGWTLKNSKTIAGVPAYLQKDFEPNVGNCTLSTLTMIFKYHREYSGKTNIPSNQHTIYSRIKTIATSHGYTPEGGTPPTKIDNIINDTWSYYNYSGYGWSYYTWSYSTFTTQVNNNRPSSINITSGYYASHSVALVGYRTYQKAWNSDKGFFKVHDNWTTNNRFIDYACFAYSTLASLSVVFP